jgi:hypothetical protein
MNNLTAFWDAIDVSTNIKRGLTAIRGISGLPALILFAALAGINFGLFWLVWTFDIASTLDWSDQAANKIASMSNTSAAPMMGQYAGYVVLALTLLPTLTELFGSIFAKAQIVFASWLVFAFSLFDMLTDWPRVVEFFDGFTMAADGGGPLGWLAFYALRIVWLFMASFGFEALLVVFAVCMVALLLQFSASRKGGAAAAAGEW